MKHLTSLPERGWALFQVFPYLTTKSAHAMFIQQLDALKTNNWTNNDILYSGKFSRDPISWKGNLQRFRGLIFAELLRPLYLVNSASGLNPAGKLVKDRL